MECVNGNVLCCRIDLQKHRIEYDLFFPVMDVQFRYNVSGKVLILPIRGDGQGNIMLSESPTIARTSLLHNTMRCIKVYYCVRKGQSLDLNTVHILISSFLQTGLNCITFFQVVTSDRQSV